jgi:hypothetical protein
VLNTNSIVAFAEIVNGTSGLVDRWPRRRVDAMAGQFRAGVADCNLDTSVATRRQIVKLLARCRGIANDSDILDEQIVEPFFIIGFPRTGTSINRVLLAMDPANRGAEAWRVNEPSQPPGERPIAVERRRAAAHVVEHFCNAYLGIRTLRPYWEKFADTLVEDEEILTLDSRDNYPVVLSDGPTLAIHTGGDATEDSYRFLKRSSPIRPWTIHASATRRFASSSPIRSLLVGAATRNGSLVIAREARPRCGPGAQIPRTTAAARASFRR